MEAALLKEQHIRKEETARMEELISVARREHDKAVLQAQQVLLQAQRDKERLAQCGELEKEQLREELDTTAKRLHSVEAERNLLMVSAVELVQLICHMNLGKEGIDLCV